MTSDHNDDRQDKPTPGDAAASDPPRVDESEAASADPSEASSETPVPKDIVSMCGLDDPARAEAFDAANFRSALDAPHGMFVEADWLGGGRAFYWFETPEARLAFLKRTQPELCHASEEEAAEIREGYDEVVGTSAREREDLEISFAGCPITWVGTIYDLARGNSNLARRTRGWFMGGSLQDEYELDLDSIIDDTSIPIPPVPDDKIEEFASSLVEFCC